MKLSFNDDVTLLDRYQSFSSEVLRLALLSLAAIGFLISTSENSTSGTHHISLSAPGVKFFLIAGIVVLSLSIFFALIHRYYSTESMALHLEHMRKTGDPQRMEKARRERDRAFHFSEWSIFGAPFFLALGAAAVGVAFILSLEL